MSRWLIRAALAYAIACAVVILLAAAGIVSGIWTVVATVPWSLWLLPVFGSSEGASTITMIGCALLNVAVLGGIGLFLGRLGAG